MRGLMMLALLVAPSWAEDSKELTEAIELPARAEKLRKAGHDPAQVREALQAARDAKLPADEAEDLLENEEKASKEHGPVDNFGAFVRERLKEGKRGKELAQAIREEHERQGKGKGKGPDGEKGRKGPHGDEDGKGHGGDKGDKGQGGDKGKGKGKGKGGKGKNK